MLLGVAFFLLTAASVWLMQWSQGIPVIWPGPGILLAYLAARPRTLHWPAILSCGVGGVLGMVVFGWPPLPSTAMIAINLFDEIVAFWLLKRLRHGRIDWFDSLDGLLCFVLVAGVVSPALLSYPVAVLSGPVPNVSFEAIWFAWFFGDSLGSLIVTPVAWLLLSGQLAREMAAKTTKDLVVLGSALLAVALSAAAVFGQSIGPFLFVPFFPILISAFKAERLGAVLSLLVLSAIGIAATVSGLGPIARMMGHSAWSFQVLQFYLATALMSALPAAVDLQQRKIVAEELRSVVRRLTRSERKAHDLANTDALTGLANRRAFMVALDRAVASNEPVTLAIMDVNNFKQINDYWGHMVGDQVLKLAGDGFREAIDDRALIARLGGDEFAVLLRQDKAADAEDLGRCITAAMGEPILIGRKEFHLTVACGLVHSANGEPRSSSRLLARADAAMYHAKRNIDQPFVLFSSTLEDDEKRKVRIHDALCVAESRAGIGLAYQPVYDLGSGQLVTLEALARWDFPGLGMVPPSEFIPIAERARVIRPLTWELLRKAVADAVAWPAAVSLSFNVSATHISSPGFAQDLLQILDAGGLPPDRLKLEITETALLADSQGAAENCDLLQQKGVRIVLDDFGAGYASVSYLRSMRFDEIKLDSSLTLNARNGDGYLLAKGVLMLCEALNVPCTAEHLENVDDVRRFTALGCRYGQGFCLQEPVPAEAVWKLTMIDVGGLTERRHVA